MLTPTAPQFRRRRKAARGRAAAPPPTPPAAPLTLVAAYYDGDAPGVHLVFDRPVVAAGAVVAAFTVIDGPDSIHFVGTGAPQQVDATEVAIFLHNVGLQAGPDVLLDAAPANGIVAVDDGGTWDGGSGLVLPFGE